MTNKQKLQCPVCRAAFRGDSVCSRCGADLSMPMLAAAKAYKLRQSAVSQLAEGNLKAADERIRKSKRLMNSKISCRIESLCLLLRNI